MPRCLNDPSKSYKGTEPSPKGLGHCAHAAGPEGVVMLGRDEREWEKRGGRWVVKTSLKPKPGGIVSVPKGAKPLTVPSLRKLAFRVAKGRAHSRPIDVYVAQDRDMAVGYTMIFSGAAVTRKRWGAPEVWDGDFVADNKRQSKGEEVSLATVAKEHGSDEWSSVLVQVCDGNVLAWNCMGPTLVYA